MARIDTGLRAEPQIARLDYAGRWALGGHAVTLSLSVRGDRRGPVRVISTVGFENEDACGCVGW